MGDDEIEDILLTIQELAMELGWTSAAVQNSDGILVGIYVGELSWVQSKTGSVNLQTIH